MLEFVLVLILLQPMGEAKIAKIMGTYDNMDECFRGRDKVVNRLGKPIKNYQAVCILHDKDVGF